MATNKKIILFAVVTLLTSLAVSSCSFFNPGKATKIVLKADAGSSNEDLQKACAVLKARLKGLVNDPEAVGDVASQTITLTFKSNTDLGRVKASILASGDLKFYDTYTNAEVVMLLSRLNDSLDHQVKKEFADDHSKKDIATPKEESVKDSGDIRSYIGKPLSNDEKRRAKIDEVVKGNPLFNIMMPSMDADFTPAPGPVIGYAEVKDTAMVNKYLNGQLAHSILPPDMQIMYGKPEQQSPGDTGIHPFTKLQVYAARIIPGISPLEAQTHISKTKADIQGSLPYVTMEMDKECTARWAAMTTRDTGKYIAIVLGDKVFSCPRVDDAITTGITEISGAFSMVEAQDLAEILLSGKLPMKLSIASVEVK